MNLLMLTKFYPYGTGEAFIENEIKVLAEYYEKIIIIACEVSKKEKIIRTIPDNVKAFKIESQSKKVQLMNDTIIGGKYLLKPSVELKNEKKECTKFIQKIFLGYFEGKSQRVFQEIIDRKYLDEVTKEPFVLYSYWFFMTARVGALIAEKYKPEYMFSRAHRYDLYSEKNKIDYLPYRRLFLNTYDNVFPCSDNGTEYLKTKYPDCTQNVNTSLLGTLDHGIGHGSDDGIFRIVSCSRMEPVKRVSKLIDTLEILDSGKYQIEWTHIGDGTEFNTIRKEVNERLKHIHVKLLGNMKNTDVMCLYKEKPFDLFINVSSSEGLPVSIMEAISFGIPVVATDVGGTSEIVVDKYTGKLIPDEFETEDLAVIIKDFIKMQNTGENLSYRNSCRGFWKKHFKAPDNYYDLCEILKLRTEERIQFKRRAVYEYKR